MYAISYYNLAINNSATVNVCYRRKKGGFMTYVRVRGHEASWRKFKTVSSRAQEIIKVGQLFHFSITFSFSRFYPNWECAGFFIAPLSPLSTSVGSGLAAWGWPPNRLESPKPFESQNSLYHAFHRNASHLSQLVLLNNKWEFISQTLFVNSPREKLKKFKHSALVLRASIINLFYANRILFLIYISSPPPWRICDNPRVCGSTT